MREQGEVMSNTVLLIERQPSFDPHWSDWPDGSVRFQAPPGNHCLSVLTPPCTWPENWLRELMQFTRDRLKLAWQKRHWKTGWHMFWFLSHQILFFPLLTYSFNKKCINIYHVLIMIATFIERLLYAWYCYCFIGIISFNPHNSVMR